MKNGSTSVTKSDANHGRATLRVSLNVKRAPVFGEIGGALLADAGVDRSCGATVGGSDVEGRGRPVAVGGDAVPGVRRRAGIVGWLSAAGAGQPGQVRAVGQAGALQGVRAHARAACRGFCWRAGWMWSTWSVARWRWPPRVAGIGRSRAALGLKETTVRGRGLRRLRARVDVLRGWFVGLAVEMAEPPPRPPPDCSALGLLVRAIADAFLAARLRLGPGAVTRRRVGVLLGGDVGRAVGQHERALGAGVRGREAVGVVSL